MDQVVLGIISRLNAHSENEYLLMSSPLDFGQFTGFYYPPGGHVIDGVSLENTLITKIREELGIEITTISEITRTPGDLPDLTIHWWLCSTTDDCIYLNPAHAADYKWLALSQIKNLPNIFPATKKFFAVNFAK